MCHSFTTNLRLFRVERLGFLKRADMVCTLEVKQKHLREETMSTSLLYHAFGIRGYRQRSVDFFEGRVCFNIEQPRKDYRCPVCGSPAVHAQGHKDRFLKTVPIGLRPTFLLVKVPRVI